MTRRFRLKGYLLAHRTRNFRRKINMLYFDTFTHLISYELNNRCTGLLQQGTDLHIWIFNERAAPPS